MSDMNRKMRMVLYHADDSDTAVDVVIQNDSIWATGILKEYMTKGFVLDDERMKQGESIFGRDYFSELLERENGRV